MSRGVIVVDHGSRREASNDAFLDFVARFADEAGFDIVEGAHMELAEPSIAEAFNRCVERGASEIIVCPFFLLPGRHWSSDIPSLTAAAAQSHPGVRFFVSAPIGGHRLLIDLLSDRIEHCQRRRDGLETACDVCQGQGGCVAEIFSPIADSP